ncbi:Trm112 family protein [Actinobacteria bacterium YIM 96077]|uniref:Trm112 family protein n=1 Tax=Phytoactinopolyspora halophila TaxID=1981511 RepID=A0A329R2C0_9ACTN|nr:Trm112 family protein [Phytoactinopolyspora halophila]AYY12046.1 Trm112 family protein [Actinobacteria bacterium YIM 96077]RAW18720.1 Trm112 family protein [Phytoactinopolyspora halophila]
MTLDPVLLDVLACPVCRASLRPLDPGGLPEAAGDRDDGGITAQRFAGHADAALTCGSCGHAYPVRDGIPVLLVNESRQV